MLSLERNIERERERERNNIIELIACLNLF